MKVGDRVIATKEMDFPPDKVNQGTEGRITQKVPTGPSSWVKFNGMGREVLVLDASLKLV